MPQTDPLISVIVPIYNVHKYLNVCLESIQNQTYTNFEAILVDDGSDDSPDRIYKKFCNADNRFRFIYQDNQGLGEARNAGLSVAKGDYICFVDSDDVLHEDYLRILYNNLVEYNADISICGYYMFTDETKIKGNNGNNKVYELNSVELLEALASDDENRIDVAWNKLMPRKWLDGFYFENKWHEDEFMINKYILRCEKAVITSDLLYGYRKRPDSITGNENKTDMRHLADIEAHEQRIDFFYKPEYQSVWIALLFQYLANKVKWYSNFTDKYGAKQIKKIIYPRYIWGFRQYLKAGGLAKRKPRMFLIVFLVSPRLYKSLSKLMSKIRSCSHKCKTACSDNIRFPSSREALQVPSTQK